MSAVTTDDVLSHVNTSASVYDIQQLIDEEEAYLARRIGPLLGERTETFLLPHPYDILRLRRPTSAVVVNDNGADLDDDLVLLKANGWRVSQSSVGWVGPVAVTYTPNDWLEVRRAVVDLVRTSLAISEQKASEGAYESETIGAYSYRRATGAAIPQAQRRAIVANLLPPQVPTSVRLLSSSSVILTDRRNVLAE